MPQKEKKEGQFYLEFETGEHIALGKTIEMDNIYQEQYVQEYNQVRMQFKIDMSAKTADNINRGIRRMMCNNWRKMHHMPMIRKQKLTQ